MWLCVCAGALPRPPQVKQCTTLSSVEEAVKGLISAWDAKQLVLDRCLPYIASTAMSPNVKLCQRK